VSAWLRATLPQGAGHRFFRHRGAGLAGNQISPRGLPLITPPKQTHKAEAFIALDQAKQLWNRVAALFLDAREPADCAAGHIGTR